MTPERAAQARLYAFVGGLIGMTVGLFTHAQLALSPGIVLLAWLLVFGAVGVVVGRLLLVVQGPDATTSTAETATQDAAPAPIDTPPDTSPRLIAVQTGSLSNSALKTTRVRALTSPMAPPALELRLLVDDFMHTVRVPLLQGVLDKLSPREIYERAHSEAIARAPRTAKDLRFRLVSVRSEGPVDADGNSPHGWTFSFVDGRLGLACDVTATARGFLVFYETRPTYLDPCEGPDWYEPATVVRVARAALAEWADADLWLRIDLPTDCWVYRTDPLVIADVDPEEGRVVNLDGVRARTSSGLGPAEAFPLSELVGYWRGEGPDDESALGRALAEEDFADGLRRLERGALRRAAAAIFAADGPGVVEELAARAEAEPQPELRRELLHLLASVPSALVPPRLQEFAVDHCEGDEKADVEALIAERRSGALRVAEHPLDQLDVLELRAAMGRSAIRTIPLRSTYDPERDLIGPLAEHGFRLTRRRRLAGDANLLVAAQFRTTDVRLEAVLMSTPLPVPCHLLHILGDGGKDLADEVRRTDLVYPRAAVLEDARSGSLTRTHRAALYVAALRLDESDLCSHFSAVLERASVDDNVLRAVLLAISVQADRRADELLSGVAEDESAGDVAAFARELLDARRAASGGIDLRTMDVGVR